MLDIARSVLSKTANSDRAAFDDDENLRLAVAHLIQMIGEAAGHVSQEYRNIHQEVPWTTIVGMRHRIVHDYLDIDFDVVWNVATMDLPPLVVQLESIVSA